MAKPTQSAKSGSDWTENELSAFNIHTINVPAEEFFGTHLADISLDHLPQAIVKQEQGSGPLCDEELMFFDYLCDASIEEDSAVDDFVAFMLRIMKYEGNGRRICLRKKLKMTMCSNTVVTTPDVSIVYRNTILLEVQEDKRTIDLKNPVPKLVAGMLAAFYNLNLDRKAKGRNSLDTKIFPSIVMYGAVPVFFLFEITQDLVAAVQAGTSPPHETLLKRCIPPVKNPDNYVSEGMFSLENRRAALKCFEAFKRFLVVDI
ncbi:hypothetical protein VKT23_000424 [Stygiomarasmius scandens]|uniref:Uncharacterized protein n=1 Tax=Marasmiellus scandens TaxID=2682957 RepID=A0ABR1K4F3_9AGAR